MANCHICHESFIPRQTFETLFTPERICQSCRLDLKRVLRENHIPVFGNTLVVLTFEAPLKPGYFHTLMHEIVHDTLSVLFFDSILCHEEVVYRLLKTLMRPLILFHSDFMTLDTLESIETMLEGK